MNEFKHLSIDEAHDLTQKVKVVIVDIRDANAYEQGHIAHAKRVTDDNIEIFLQEMDKSVPLICYCYHGVSSQNAAAFFAQKGFNEAYSIDGGYDAWKGKYANK